MGVDIALFRYFPLGSNRENIANQGEHRMHNEIIVIGSIEPFLNNPLVKKLSSNPIITYLVEYRLDFFDEKIEKFFIR